jgi:hypothetical protein
MQKMAVEEEKQQQIYRCHADFPSHSLSRRSRINLNLYLLYIFCIFDFIIRLARGGYFFKDLQKILSVFHKFLIFF